MRNTSVQAVERATKLLLFLAEHPGATLRELGGCIGCSTTTAYRLLNALSQDGLVATGPDGRPTLGLAVVKLYGAWSRQTTLRQVAYPQMVSLRDRTGESVTLHVR